MFTRDMFVRCICNQHTGPVYIYIFITTANLCQYFPIAQFCLACFGNQFVSDICHLDIKRITCHRDNYVSCMLAEINSIKN